MKSILFITDNMSQYIQLKFPNENQIHIYKLPDFNKQYRYMLLTSDFKRIYLSEYTDDLYIEKLIHSSKNENELFDKILLESL